MEARPSIASIKEKYQFHYDFSGNITEKLKFLKNKIMSDEKCMKSFIKLAKEKNTTVENQSPESLSKFVCLSTANKISGNFFHINTCFDMN